jgi:hypothetical protein
VIEMWVTRVVSAVWKIERVRLMAAKAVDGESP